MPRNPKLLPKNEQPTKLGDAPEWYPLFLLTTIGILLGAIFLLVTYHEFCLERLVWYESLIFSLPQSSLMYTPFERDTHALWFIRMLYVLHLYLLSWIILLYVLHLYLLSVIILLYVLHLDLLEHGGGFVLKKLLISHASLKSFWESLK